MSSEPSGSELYLVDATYELFRGHFAIKSGIRAPDGTVVTGVYALVSSLLSLVASKQISHIGCATDHVVTSWRNDEFDGYKTGEGVPEELLVQFPLAERAIESLGIELWRMTRYEADDGVATAATRFGDHFDRVVLCSPDKDFAQLVEGEHIVMWDRRRDGWYDEAGVLEKWGVPPVAIPAWLALVGDAADGLPGVSGWGKKSAATVLRRYHSVADIPENPADWDVDGLRGAARLARNLNEARRDALLYERLATLSRDSEEVTSDVEDLRFRGVDAPAFIALCEDFGFGRLRDRGLALARE